jgi:hypothetical protein
MEFENQGKHQQLNELNFDISDELLEEYLSLNFKHLSLDRQETQDKDVALITWYAKKKFIGGIDLFSSMNLIQKDTPTVLPYIQNIVGTHSERIPLQPQNFNGKLFPPQASLINRMIQLEGRPPVLYAAESRSRIKFPVGLISERLSFGKTYCLPALICHQPLPIGYDVSKTNLPINLVVCGTKVAKEWKKNLENTISSTSGISWIVIELQKQLEQLQELISKKNYPQILVVKDGDITFNGKKDKAFTHVLNMLAEEATDGLTKNVDDLIVSEKDGQSLPTLYFARTIYDDFDMLKIERDTYLPSAHFSWFVSGTASGNMPKLKTLTYTNDVPNYVSVNSISIILDAVSSVECNKEYSSVEYNIPKVDVYVTCDSITSIIKNIGENTPDKIDVDDHNEIIDASLLQGTANVPYVYDKSKLKILVAIEDKKQQQELVCLLNAQGIKSVKLTKANIDKFAREDTIVGVSGNLFGVNMGFLSHIVIGADDYLENATNQIIGRGQRLSRKQNLQVYLALPSSDEEPL